MRLPLTVLGKITRGVSIRCVVTAHMNVVTVVITARNVASVGSVANVDQETNTR